MNTINKINITLNGITAEYTLGKATLDTVIDDLEKIIVNGEEVDNPYYQKTLRSIIEEDEEVSAAAMNIFASKMGLDENSGLSALSTDVKTSIIAAINELNSKISSGEGSGSGNSYVFSMDSDGSLVCIKNGSGNAFIMDADGSITLG